jgi:SPP1 family predicted phage head-tail adaptor
MIAGRLNNIIVV